MKAVISCQGFGLTEAISSSVEERHEKCQERMKGQPLKASLEKERENVFRVHLEFISDAFGPFNATAKGEDLYGLIRQASDKLLRQMREFKSKHEGKQARKTLNSVVESEEDMA
jgi:ribosome-associated translation inhibitor RaiA